MIELAFSDPRPAEAYETLIYIAVAAAMSALSYGISYLVMQANRPRAPRPIDDDRQPTLAVRGSYLPMIIGRRKVTPIFGLDGDLKSKKIEGGGKGGGSQTIGYTYTKTGVHWVCLGTASRLYRIWENGKVIYGADPAVEPPLDRTTTPSGSLIATKHAGSFYWFWGELDQPVNTRLGPADQLGVASAWPGVCYAEWRPKKLGATPTWPQMDYEVEVELEQYLAGSNQQLNTGVNPVQAMWRLLTAPYPYGIGMDATWLDAGSFNGVGALMESEDMGFNLLIRDGLLMSEKMADMMGECGLFLPQVGEKLVLLPIRQEDPESVPVLTDDVLVNPDPEIRQSHGDVQEITRYAFFVYDRANSYRPADVGIDDDAAARHGNKVRPESMTFPDITDRKVGYRVAQRRMMDRAADGTHYTLTVTRGARNLLPGQPFQLPAVGPMRVASVQPRFDTTQMEIDAVVDQFGIPPTDYLPPDVDDEWGGGLQPDPVADLLVVADLLPPGLQDGTGHLFGVARVRANPAIVGADVWISANGSSYLPSRSQDQYASGGVLLTALGATVEDDPVTHELEAGPTVNTYNSDILEVLDLTGNDEAWRAGIQIAVIGNEWIMLRRVQATTLGWQLRGCVRGAFGSPREAHAIGDPCVIFQRSSETVMSSGIVTAGATIYVKTQPKTTTEVADLSTITPVTFAVP